MTKMLEPVVNRCQVPEEVIQEIVDDGYTYLEEQAEAIREERSQAQMAGRLQASFGQLDTD